MDIHELESLFLQKRQYNSENANELIDFAKKAYIHNEISINEYRKLVRELEALGAEIPDEPTTNSEE
ncbi:YppF family protein [Pseudoneobacillus sp. C159]